MAYMAHLIIVQMMSMQRMPLQTIYISSIAALVGETTFILQA